MRFLYLIDKDHWIFLCFWKHGMRCGL